MAKGPFQRRCRQLLPILTVIATVALFRFNLVSPTNGATLGVASPRGASSRFSRQNGKRNTRRTSDRSQEQTDNEYRRYRRLEKSQREINTAGNEASGGGNRKQHLRSIPVNQSVLKEIRRSKLTNSAKRAGGATLSGPSQKSSTRRQTRFQRTGDDEDLGRTKSLLEHNAELGSKFSLLSRYHLYGDLDEHDKSFLGYTGKSKIRFVLSAHTKKMIPDLGNMPEIAFAGRSNVGKSSLLNAIGLTTIARSSNTPGLTQSLNFYRLREDLSLVDLPGYGFAFAREDKIKTWADLAKTYYRTRQNLDRVFVVLDARHGALERDVEFMEMLSSASMQSEPHDRNTAHVRFQVILNKADLVTNPEDLARQYQRTQDIIKGMPGAIQKIHMISSQTGAGVVQLVREISDISEGHQSQANVEC